MGPGDRVSVDGDTRNAGGVTHSPARRCRRRCRRLGRDGDGFGQGEHAASNNCGSDGEMKRRGRTAWAAARSVSSGMCSDSGRPNGAVEATFKPPGAFGHRRPQQPIRARRGATLLLIGGPHASAFSELK
jgi:hypothetical protein